MSGSDADGLPAVTVPLNLEHVANRNYVVVLNEVTGSWRFAFGGVTDPPEGILIRPPTEVGCPGGYPCTVMPTGGLSGLSDGERFWYLTGIFVGAALPEVPPPPVDFTDLHDALDFAPELGQAFFIGDGRTTSGSTQRFHVPTGATRLLLGMADICQTPEQPNCYYDNTGDVTLSGAICRMRGNEARARLEKNCPE